MSAEERVDVFWQKLPISRSVLGPVGHVAHQFCGGHCQKKKMMILLTAHVEILIYFIVMKI